MTEGNSERIAGTAPHRRAASPLRTLLAVLWSFFGVRRAKDLERDASELNPLHVVVAGLLVAAVFVGALFMLVRWVIRSGIAV